MGSSGRSGNSLRPEYHRRARLSSVGPHIIAQIYLIDAVWSRRRIELMTSSMPYPGSLGPVRQLTKPDLLRPVAAPTHLPSFGLERAHRNASIPSPAPGRRPP